MFSTGVFNDWSLKGKVYFPSMINFYLWKPREREGAVSELMDGWGCAILPLEMVSKTLIFA